MLQPRSALSRSSGGLAIKVRIGNDYGSSARVVEVDFLGSCLGDPRLRIEVYRSFPLQRRFGDVWSRPSIMAGCRSVTCQASFFPVNTKLTRQASQPPQRPQTLSGSQKPSRCLRLTRQSAKLNLRYLHCGAFWISTKPVCWLGKSRRLSLALNHQAITQERLLLESSRRLTC